VSRKVEADAVVDDLDDLLTLLGLERPGREIDIRRERMECSPARDLIVALNAELSGRYAEDGTMEQFSLQQEEVAQGRGAFVVAYVDGQPRGCGAIRLIDPDTAEVKRMYVEPVARGLGVGRRVLDALEAEARALGVGKMVLETGPRQPEALALYSRAGFSTIGAFGEHVNSPLSIFLGKTL
jgi:putative acetyltransferase